MTIKNIITRPGWRNTSDGVQTSYRFDTPEYIQARIQKNGARYTVTVKIGFTVQYSSGFRKLHTAMEAVEKRITKEENT